MDERLSRWRRVPDPTDAGTMTVADECGLSIGTLATVVSKDEYVPVNSLVRVVADEGDSLVAVDVLIPTEPFDGEYEWATGHKLNVRSVNKGTRVLDTLDPERVYYWASVVALRPLGDSPTVGPDADNKETDHD